MINHGRTTEARAQSDIEHSRRELLNFLMRQRQDSAISKDTKQSQRNAHTDTVSGINWSALVEAGLSSWWHGHPARAGAMLLGSAAEDYARKKPLQAVTIAAVAGAAVVLLKPWRLISTSALMLSLFRSSNFTGMASSVLESAAESIQKERT